MQVKVHRNAWGNLNGYEGSQRVRDFGTDEHSAAQWLAEQVRAGAKLSQSPSNDLNQARIEELVGGPIIPPKPDQFWLELPKPRDDSHADQICAKANAMLKRIDPATVLEFWWHARRGCYCITKDEAGGFLEMADRGQWIPFAAISIN